MHSLTAEFRLPMVLQSPEEGRRNADTAMHHAVVKKADFASIRSQLFYYANLIQQAFFPRPTLTALQLSSHSFQDILISCKQ